MKRIGNYINGRIHTPLKGGYIPVYNPAIGEQYAEAPDSTQEDLDLALAAAKKAFPIWAKTSQEERHKILTRLADLIDENFENLAKAECIDNGKPLWLTQRVDIPRASANIRFFANAITQYSSESHKMEKAINYTLREPIGVVAAISPWNLPLYLFTWKIAPALAVGNTVIAKPSEVTPMTAYLFSELCILAGLPPGVLNILHGNGASIGAALTDHPEIKAISFTGSTKVGREIAIKAAGSFKKASLEMGGKNANVIFADCDYDKMLKTTLRSSFENQGQICLCGSRILVEESIYDRFKKDFVDRVGKLVVGNPMNKNTKLGALVSEGHMEKVLSYVALAKEEGGTILTGGERVHPKGNENGWFVAPTVVEGLGPETRCNQEEIFGPVVTIMSFKTEEEAIDLANDSLYGLSCSVWTSNISRAHQLAAKIDTGIVWINTWLKRDLRTPFGGMKGSGMGREGGLEALRFFTDPKNVCIEYE